MYLPKFPDNTNGSGVFAPQPTSTPKYALNEGLRDAENRDTLARLYVELADTSSAALGKYLQELPADEATQSIARVLLGGYGYIDFILNQVTESHQEQVQVDKSLADTFASFAFGRMPPVWAYTGVLYNTYQDDQRVGFYLAYENLLRASRCAQGSALVHLKYDSMIVTGFLINHTQTLQAETETNASFSFNMVVVRTTLVKPPKKFTARGTSPRERAPGTPVIVPVRDVQIRTAAASALAGSPPDGAARRQALLQEATRQATRGPA